MTDTRTSAEDTETTGGGTSRRQRAIEAYGSARGRVGDAGRRAGDALD
jgi:hypothetical protein